MRLKEDSRWLSPDMKCNHGHWKTFFFSLSGEGGGSIVGELQKLDQNRLRNYASL